MRDCPPTPAKRCAGGVGALIPFFAARCLAAHARGVRARAWRAQRRGRRVGLERRRRAGRRNHRQWARESAPRPLDQSYMTNKLIEICANKRIEVAVRKTAISTALMAAHLAAQSPPRGFRRALDAAVAAGGYGLIAEIKKASPSK